MRRPVTLLSAAVLCALATAPAAPAHAKKKPKPEPAPVVQEAPPSMWKHESTEPLLGELSVERYTLTSNGLTLMLVVDDASPTFSYHTYFDVGSSDEDEAEGTTGIAHLFEHMMFKRTDQFDDSHFSRTLEEAGTPDLNAWTWLDITAYHASLGKEHLPLLVGLEAARMDGLVIDEAQLNAEREVVINERRYRVDDDPEGLIEEQLWGLAFTATRYHWPTIGWRKDLDTISVEQCNRFYKDYYAPNNARIVLVGDVDRAAALKLIEGAYGGIPASDLVRRDHGVEPEQTEARRIDMEVAAETELFTLGYKAPALAHADTPALMVLDAILSAGNSSRLQRKLVDGGLVADVSSSPPPFQHEALFSVSATMRAGKAADAALQVVRAELNDLRQTLVSPMELNRARNQLLSYQFDELEGNSGLAGFIGFNELAGGSWQSGLTRFDAIRAVTAADVQRVANTWLVEAHSSVVVGHPKGKKALTFKPKDLPKPGAGAVLTLPTVLGRPSEGAPALTPGAIDERETGGWTRLMVYDPAVPKVWFRLVLPFGSTVEPAGQLGITNLAAEMVLRGTTDRPREVFEETLEGLGASVEAIVSEDSVTFAGDVLAENWSKLAVLLEDAFRDATFAEADFEDLVDEVQADLDDARNDDRWLGRSFYDKGLFGPHPYGRPILGTKKTLAAVTAADAKAFYQQWFGSRNAILALLGAFDAGAGSDLARIAGKLDASPPEVDFTELPPAPEGRRLWLVAKPDRSQLQMNLGHFTARMDDPAYPAMWLANEAFGGSGFGARMMAEIREKNGYSYGAYGTFEQGKQASTYTMWIFPALEQAEPALKLLLSLYEEFAAKGLAESELNYARGAILNSAAFYADTPRKRLSYEVRKRVTGEDPLALLGAVKAATLEEVNAAAAAGFHPANLFGTVVAPKEFLPVLQGVVGADAVTVVPYDQE